MKEKYDIFYCQNCYIWLLSKGDRNTNLFFQTTMTNYNCNIATFFERNVLELNQEISNELASYFRKKNNWTTLILLKWNHIQISSWHLFYYSLFHFIASTSLFIFPFSIPLHLLVQLLIIVYANMTRDYLERNIEGNLCSPYSRQHVRDK